MAELIYGAEGAPIRIPDYLLAHVKLVVATKLRRNESFLMSWRHADGEGRSSVWLQPAIPLRFVFDGPDEPAIDRTLLAQLAASASSNGGLVIDLREDAYASRPAAATSSPEDSPHRLATTAA